MMEQQAESPPAARPQSAAPADLNDAVFAWIILICGLLYLVALSRVGVDFGGTGSEGISISAAARIGDGEAMYRDFTAPYGPGRYYALSIVLKTVSALRPLWSDAGTAGTDLITARNFWAFLAAVAAFACYLACRGMMSPLPAAFAAVSFVLLHPPLAEIYTAFFVAVAALLIRLDHGRTSLSGAFVIGLVIGVAYLFGELAGLAILSGALATFTLRAAARSDKEGMKVEGAGRGRLTSWLKIPLVAVAAAVPAALGCWIGRPAGPIRFLYPLGAAPMPNPFATGDAAFHIEAAAIYMPPVIYAATLFSIVRRNLRGAPRPGDAEAFGLCFTGAVLYAALREGASVETLLVGILPALILLGRFMSILAGGVKRILSAEDRKRGMAHVVARSALILLLFAVAELFSVHYLFGREDGALRLYTAEPPCSVRYKGTELLVTLQQRRVFLTVESYFEKELGSPPVEGRPAADTKKIFGIPSGGFWYVYFNRPNPTRYEHTGTMSEEDVRNLIDRLVDVDYVIFDSRSLSALGPAAFAERYGLLEGYLFTYYQAIDLAAGGLRIFKRRRQPPAEPEGMELFAAAAGLHQWVRPGGR